MFILIAMFYLAINYGFTKLMMIVFLGQPTFLSEKITLWQLIQFHAIGGLIGTVVFGPLTGAVYAVVLHKVKTGRMENWSR
jgi:hypothetical protein